MPPARRFVRGRATWYCYLLSGFFTFILNIQGNIVPFLRDELGLSYRIVGLHPSAIAVGMIVAGALTERVLAALGRRLALLVAVAGTVAGMLLLGAAPSAPFSIGACLLVGLTGAMIPGIIAGLLSQLHGAHRAQAYAECGALTYACAMTAGLSMGLAVTLGLGWRAALLWGAACGIAIALVYGRDRLPEAPVRAVGTSAALPAACWAYLVLLGLGVALEFSVLLWCPEFLERVVGLGRSGAAIAAATFSAAMLLGRWGGSVLVRGIAPTRLYSAALLLVAPGFALYWGVATPVAAIVGLFLIGLSVALLYPLGLGFILGAAGVHGDAAGARTGLAAGTALLLSPIVLGALADAVGLRGAHLVIPALAVALILCFAIARALERRATALVPAMQTVVQK
jgi:fucose permease